MRVFVDIETYSPEDLPRVGVYRYASHPDFQILLAGWRVDGGPIHVDYTHEDAVRTFRRFLAMGAQFVAHNAPFERICFSIAIGLPVGEYLPPEDWDDTQAIAAELGFPKKLEKLAPAIGAEEKDTAGTRLINRFSKPNKNGERNLPKDFPLEWLDFVDYLIQDVDTLYDCFMRLMTIGGWPNQTERDLYIVDQKINDRGIAIDLPMARKAVKIGGAVTREMKARSNVLTGLDNANSIQQLHRWAREEGIGHLLPNLQADTVEAALRADLTPLQREVLELRQDLALAAPQKFASALASQTGGRLRGAIRFFGAHTGRWAGSGTQPHNLPRAAFVDENGKWDAFGELCAILDLLVSEETSNTILKKLVRPMFIGPFTVVDYAAIEARVISWLAGEEWALQAFRDGRDIYVETAARMGGLSRAQGKVAVLALGYNGGPGSLRAMANEGDEVLYLDDRTLYEKYVWPWRETNARIVRFWKMLDQTFMTGGKVGDHIYIEKRGRDRLIHLPSGRAICYRNVRRVRHTDPDTGRERFRIMFKSPMGYMTDTYGGRLAENITQAVARDLLGEALIRLENAGYPVVAHVHDEILVEGRYPVEEISEIMCKSPEWAKGLPVDGDGDLTERYRKI